MNKKVEVNFNDEKISGILIKEDNNYLSIKLKSGYNAILDKSKIKILREEKLENESKKKSLKFETKSNLKKIVILHTGGTIASKVDYKTGAVSSKFDVEELLALYPELNELANLKPEMIANLSSEDMRFDHWNLLINSIKKNIEGVDGIIISHGTDTMHYTCAALEYALKNLNLPVILVGAQRSSDRASSDAFSNLKAAINFIIWNSERENAFRRVGLCMHSSISKGEYVLLDSINVKKMHSSRRDAFKQINYNPYALILNEEIMVLRKELESKLTNKNLESLNYNTNLKIGFFKSHPNLFSDEIKALSIYDGVVVEGTGLGHLAVSEFDDYTKINKENLKEISNLIKKTKLVMGVQTNYGECNMNIYSSGRELKKTGILGQGLNLTTETLFCRLAYCLSSKDFDKEWNSNLEGFEIRSEDMNY